MVYFEENSGGEILNKSSCSISGSSVEIMFLSGYSIFDNVGHNTMVAGSSSSGTGREIIILSIFSEVGLGRSRGDYKLLYGSISNDYIGNSVYVPKWLSNYRSCIEYNSGKCIGEYGTAINFYIIEKNNYVEGYINNVYDYRAYNNIYKLNNNRYNDLDYFCVEIGH